MSIFQTRHPVAVDGFHSASINTSKSALPTNAAGNYPGAAALVANSSPTDAIFYQLDNEENAAVTPGIPIKPQETVWIVGNQALRYARFFTSSGNAKIVVQYFQNQRDDV